MTEDETDVALKIWGADVLALRMCVMQMLADRMREQNNPEAALRTFGDDVHGLLAATTSTKGSVVQMFAIERLAKLTETVKLLMIGGDAAK